ncbi:related to YEA4 - uridine diphosphate-N-acetylglucosamine [Ustilago trichophora]|uniref:Related to YEA4 - uridine diphosphate-N-acetylglucosamine n=1 Tax=Ustilago trichophora TaxID=86804 RepID=A0A5C3DZX1_9BASI|nr:related to YEA4 - uridine diphosphate-N-acetylglucosamine [Ustilago trichophora]
MPSSHSASRLRHRSSNLNSSRASSTPSNASAGKPPTTYKDPSSSFPSSAASDILKTTASEWLLILTLIFGGCCSNAFTLELATRQLPSSGTLITFAQFLVTTLSALPHFLILSSRFPFITLRQRKVPLYRWLVQVAFYLTTSLLNNWAFGFNVPMAVHIVFRSGGLVVNMILGYLVQGRHYSPVQIFSVLLITAGVLSSTLYSTHAPSSSSSSSSSSPSSLSTTPEGKEYATGVLLLFSALVLTGFMGLWQEKTFKLYGNQNWRESMFYSHLLSLPLFALRPASLVADVRNANATTPWWFGFGPPSSPHNATPYSAGMVTNLLALISPPSNPLARQPKKDSTPTRIFDMTAFLPIKPSGIGIWIPSFYPPLILNVATQLLCINGVNRLTAKVSSLSVTLVLVVRKALSLMVSVMLVQRSAGTIGLWSGAICVLAGTVGYSFSKPVASGQGESVKKNGKSS